MALDLVCVGELRLKEAIWGTLAEEAKPSLNQPLDLSLPAPGEDETSDARSTSDVLTSDESAFFLLSHPIQPDRTNTNAACTYRRIAE